MSFNKNLTDYRKRKGLSQEQLAFQIGVSRQAVSKWETGLSQPELINIEKICEVLEITPNDLMDFENQSLKTNNKKNNIMISGFVIIFIVIGIFSLLNHYNEPKKPDYHGFYVNELRMSIKNTDQDYKYYSLSFYPSVANENFDYTIIVEYDDGYIEKFEASYDYSKCISDIKLQRNKDAMLYAQIKYENIIFSSPLMKVWAIQEEGQ